MCVYIYIYIYIWARARWVPPPPPGMGIPPSPACGLVWALVVVPPSRLWFGVCAQPLDEKTRIEKDK